MARTAVATKAHSLHARLSINIKKVTLKEISSILNSPERGFTIGSWVQGIEKNYNHCDNYYLKKGGLGVRILWERSGGKLRATLKEEFGLAVESPLRQDLRRHFGGTAQAVIATLEKWHRERKLKPSESADRILPPKQRSFALKVASQQGQFNANLAKWMFYSSSGKTSKNWSALCARAAEKVTYYGKFGFGKPIPVKFFRLPQKGLETNNWQTTGAKSYIKDVSSKLQAHRNWLDSDLDCIRKSAETQKREGDHQIFISMSKVLEYRYALRNMYSKTERNEIIQNNIFPQQKYDELYVPYNILKTRRGWIIGINFGRKLPVSDKDMGFK